jgi:predicted nucleotidyltransferase
MAMMLETLFESRARRALLSRTLLSPDRDYYLSELVRLTHLAPRTVQLELDRLVKGELLIERRDGNRRYVRANLQNPLYEPLRQILMKSEGFADVLAAALGADDKVELALVFGSMASGTARSESDVDLLVVGDTGLEEVARHLRGAVTQLGREINPVVWSRSEWQRRVASKDHFLERILSGPRVMIIGDQNVLKAMGGQRVDSLTPNLATGSRGSIRSNRARAKRRGKRPRS